MPRLPRSGQDAGTWGTILNDYLSVEHNADGTLKKATDITTAKAAADQALTAANEAYVKPGTGIPATDLASSVQASLGKADTALQAPSTLTDRGTWTTATSYAINDVIQVTVSGQPRRYVARTAHAASAAFATDVANWVAIDADTSGTYAPRQGSSQTFSLPRVSKKLSAMNSGSGRLITLHFGDSYGPKLSGKLYPLLESLAGGNAGGGLVDGAGATQYGQIVTSGTTGTVTNNVADFSYWPSGLTHTYATGATRTYQSTYGQTICDTIKVYYPKDPGYGTFKIQVDGIDAAGFTIISAVGAIGVLGIATVSVTRAQHTITVANLTGAHKIAYVVAYDSTNNGLVTLPIAQGGIALSSPTTTAWSNFQAFLADISPDVMFFEMKEDSSYYAAALASLFGAASAGAPGMDVIAIGSPPVSVNDVDQVAQNAILKTACDVKGYVYWDSYAIFGSYARLSALGWNNDGTHVDPVADEWRAMLLARDSGLLSMYQRLVSDGNIRVRGLNLSKLGAVAGGCFFVVWHGGADDSSRAKLRVRSSGGSRPLAIISQERPVYGDRPV